MSTKSSSEGQVTTVPQETGIPEETGDPLLAVRDLRVTYRGGSFAAVRGIDLEVRPAEVVAIVGESGSGKSTTAHAVLGLLAEGGQISGGRIDFAGDDLTTVARRRMGSIRGREIGLIPQDPTIALNPVYRVGDQVAEVLRIHRLANRHDARREAVGILEHVGLDDAPVRARQYPHELSGGMRQRVLIAIAIAAKPKLLIADEPTSSLDATVQRRILDRIDGLVQERDMAVLLITHDLGVAADRAHRIVVMSQGTVVEAGAAQEILRAPQHPYTRNLVRAAPSLANGRRARATTAPSPTEDDSPLLTVEGLVKDFPLPRGSAGPRSHRAVAEVSFSIGRGETFALVGESGSGKSTTARLALRLTEPTAGRIHFDGNDITELRGSGLRLLRQQMQLVYQNPYTSLDPRFTVAEVVDEPLRVFRAGDRAVRARRVRELLDRVALPARVLRSKPAELSGGQRQRVAIARALALSPRLVVCDEPVSALDVSVQDQVLRLLAELQADLGLSYLFISHDLAVVREIADRVGVMWQGRLVETGETESLFATPRHEYTRELLAAIPGAT
jgi:peptide/nickel transport system ATP-binding protein